MQLFQNVGLSVGFRKFASSFSRFHSFTEGVTRFLDTRYGALHILPPVMARDTSAFCTIGDHQLLQTAWARENGLKSSDLRTILLAQIEHHRTEVFYNLDPMRYGSDFVRKLPACVKTTVCWRAAPSGRVDLSAYDLVVSNFPSILEDWRGKGCRVSYFFPAHDPVMDQYANGRTDDIDLVFSGGFTRHHKRRVASLEAAAAVPGIRARLHLEDSRPTRLANALPFLPGLAGLRHPRAIRSMRAAPVYGRDLYKALSSAKIVLNGAVDMAGDDRGNMRCFEACGCGALLLTDAGNYPEGFVDGETMITYSTAEQLPKLIEQLLGDMVRVRSVARAGRAMVRQLYSKQRQWTAFNNLI